MDTGTEVLTFGERIIASIQSSQIIEKLIYIVIAVILFFIARHLVRALINRIFDEKRRTDLAEKKRMVTLRKTTIGFMDVTLLVVLVLVSLSFFVDVGALLAVAGVGTIAIGFGTQTFVEDVVSGFVIIFEDQFAVGDYVSVDNHYGAIEKIGVRTTHIRERYGELFIIHNGKIDRLTNYSRGPLKGQVVVGVAYEENLEHVIQVLEQVNQEVYDENADLFQTVPEVFGVTDLDASSVNISILFDEYASKRVKSETVLRQRIKEVFDQEGIEIPYEKRVVYNGEIENDTRSVSNR